MSGYRGHALAMHLRSHGEYIKAGYCPSTHHKTWCWLRQGHYGDHQAGGIKPGSDRFGTHWSAARADPPCPCPTPQETP